MGGSKILKAEIVRAEMAWFKEHLICQRCRKNEVCQSSSTRCSICAAAHNLACRKAMAAKRAAGKCYQCGRPPAPGMKACAKCLASARERRRRRKGIK